jgi:CIC family chloride channel protein
MLAVVSANITAKEIFHQDSVFTMLMHDAGLDYRNDPIAQSLRRTGVASVMNRSFVESQPLIELEHARTLLSETPQWVIVRNDEDNRSLLPAADLARFLEDHVVDRLDLMAIPARRREIVAGHMQVSLQEARVALEDSGAEAIYVRRQIAPLTYRTFGVLLRQDVESSYALRR